LSTLTNKKADVPKKATLIMGSKDVEKPLWESVVKKVGYQFNISAWNGIK